PNTEVKLLSADCSEGLPLVRVGRRHANEKQLNESSAVFLSGCEQIFGFLLKKSNGNVMINHV
uniref:hypothetical protein n=1 Tax=Enterococcus mundtii TaxID=53346 RepID=UPI001E5B75C7